MPNKLNPYFKALSIASHFHSVYLNTVAEFQRILLTLAVNGELH